MDMCPNTIDAVYVSTILCLEHATVLAVLYFVFHFIISFYCHVTQDLHLEYIELYSWKQHAFIIRVTQIKKEFLCLISISARNTDEQRSSVFIYVRKNQRGNQKWTLQRHWKHWTHKTQDEHK